MYYLGHWEKAPDVSTKLFEDKMKKFLADDKHHEAFIQVLLEFHAHAGEYKARARSC